LWPRSRIDGRKRDRSSGKSKPFGGVGGDVGL
jgi:hypothetical protein